jgi:lia operon protein LiaG
MNPLPTWPFHRLTAVAAASMLGLTAGAGMPDAQSIERYAMPAGSVALYDLAGRVTLEAGTGGEVVVEITRGGADGARLKVQQGPAGDWQTLRVVFPSNHVVYEEPGTWGMQVHVGNDGRFDDEALIRIPAQRHRVDISGRGPGLDAHADLHVRVPAGRTLALFLAAGAATVTNVDGDLRLSVGSAAVTTRNTRGSLSVESGSGQLRVNHADGDVVLDTGSGGALVRGVRGDHLSLDSGSGEVTVLDVEVDRLKADSGSGTLELADIRAPEISLDSGSGTVRLGLLRGPLRSLHIDSGSGGVTLQAPRELDATFTISTGSGGVRINLPHQITTRDPDQVRGRFGKGTGRITIESGSGGVRIVPHETSSRLQGGVGGLLRYAFTYPAL